MSNKKRRQSFSTHTHSELFKFVNDSNNGIISTWNKDIVKRYFNEKHSKKRNMVNELIITRLNEINKMCSVNNNQKIKIDTLSCELQEKIKALKEISTFEYKNLIEQRLMNKRESFKRVARIILIIVKYSIDRRKYFLEKWLEKFDRDMNENQEELEKMKKISLKQLHSSKSALTIETRGLLRTYNPLERDDDIAKKILWNLKRINAFELIIPKVMMMELCKRVQLYHYENGRIIAEEKTQAERLYYVISGKLNLVKRFDLATGVLYKIVGCINRGESNDPSEVEKEKLRETSIVAQGATEVLILEKDDIMALRFNNQGLPFEYLKREFDLFKTFPFSTEIDLSELIMYQYFGPNQIITHDADESPWLYIVKSGIVKLVKKVKLPKIDKKYETENHLPSLFYSPNDKPKTPLTRLLNLQSRISHSDSRQSVTKLLTENRTQSVLDRPKPSENIFLSREFTLPVLKPNSEKMNESEESKNENFIDNENIPFLEKIIRNRKRSKTSFQLTNTRQSTLRPITRDQVTISEESAEIKRAKTSHSKYVIVDHIVKGAVFSLNFVLEKRKVQKAYMKQKTIEKDKIILISEGAEIILVNKNYFIKHADVDTQCKIEKLIMDLTTGEKAKNYIFEGQKWNIYKKNVLNNAATIKKKINAK